MLFFIDVVVEKLTFPVFMIGMPRSGTSILSEAISLHKDLAWLSNYLKWFPRFPQVSILNRIYSVSGLNIHLRGKKKQGDGVASAVRRLLPYSAEMFPAWEYCCGKRFSMGYMIAARATEEEKKCVRKYVASVLKYHGKARFFAKFTGPPRIEYLSSIFPEAFFIHIVRDPRAVVSSLLQVDFWRRNGLNAPWWKGGLTKEDIEVWKDFAQSPVALAAVQWRRVLEVADLERQIVREKRYVELTYEDFVRDPHGIVDFTLKRCGLPMSMDIHSYLETTGKLRNMNYKYKTNLGRRDIRMVEDITRFVALKKGYDF